MYTLDATLAAVLASGAPTMLVRLVALDAHLTETASFALSAQAVTSGSATADLARDARRSASLEVTATVPATMLVQGSVLRIETGALVASGPAYVPLVTGFVTAGNVSMSSGLTSVTVESFLSACRQEAGVTIHLPMGMTLVTALHTLIDPVLPFVDWVVDGTAIERTLGSDVPVLPTDSRLDVALRLARAVGCEMYDDRIGRIVVRARQDPATQETARTMTLPVSLDRGFSRPPVNAQGVEASPGVGEPFYILEEITDPGHPWHKDRIGLRMAPMIRSDAIPDPDAARALARSWLAGRMLRADELTSTEQVRHLDLDEGDVVAREEAITGTSGRYVIQSISYPIASAEVRITDRAALPLFLEDG
jgi:hypothetical protein